MQWKLHITIIAAMTVVLSLGYYVIKPSPENVTIVNQVGRIHITIVQADWGLNCNPLIEKARKEALRKSITAVQTEKKQPLPEVIQPNNILSQLQTQCDKKLTCDISADIAILGDPFSDCSKELVIGWRCFSYDKLQTKTLNESESHTIKCEESSPTPEEASSLTPETL